MRFNLIKEFKMISSFKLLGKTLSFSVLTVACLMTSSLAYADGEYSDEEIEEICSTYVPIRAFYSLSLFLAKNEQERKETRAKLLELLKEEGISKNKKLMDKLYTPTMAFEEKETKKTLKIPYETRKAIVGTDQFKTQVAESTEIYVGECVSMLKGAKLK